MSTNCSAMLFLGTTPTMGITEHNCRSTEKNPETALILLEVTIPRLRLLIVY